MTTTLTLRYSAALDCAEMLGDDGIWSVPDHPPSEEGGLHVSPGRCYRATHRLMCHRPPFAGTLTQPYPSPRALELGLDAPAWDRAGYIYLRASSGYTPYIPPHTILIEAVVIILPADGVWGAAAALRRAGLLAIAERVVEAYQHSAYAAITALRDILAALPAILASRPPPPPDQLDPARGLIPTLEAAWKILRGEALT